MITVVGCLLVALCGLMLGMAAVLRERATLRRAERACEIARFIRYSVCYWHSPADKIIEQAEQEFSGPLYTQKGDEFDRLLSKLCASLGRFRLSEQLDCCDRLIEQLELCLNEVRCQTAKNTRVKFALCSSGGIMLAILLI